MIEFDLDDLDYEHHLPPGVLLERCLEKAMFMTNHPNRFFLSEQIPSLGKLTSMLVKLEVEEFRKSKLLDGILPFEDEIISISELGERELMDITVSGNNTFYANGILTKNSHGLAMTVDLLLAMIRSEELDDQNLVMFKQLKNRFSDMAAKLRFVVGIDRSKMLLFNAETEPNMSGGKVVSNGSPPTKQQRKEMTDTSTGEILNRKPSYGTQTQRSKFEGIKV